MTYLELLQAEKWQMKRNEIIKRDKGRCRVCGHQATNQYSCGDAIYTVRRIISDEMHNEVETKHYIGRPSNGKTHLQVHHKYYVSGKMPWEYDDDALVTLCNHCHKKLHETTSIPVYNYAGEVLGYTACHRCHGLGLFPEYISEQNDGICFHCGGARYEELIGE